MSTKKCCFLEEKFVVELNVILFLSNSFGSPEKDYFNAAKISVDSQLCTHDDDDEVNVNLL
jgi:hypothetical protein